MTLGGSTTGEVGDRLVRAGAVSAAVGLLLLTAYLPLFLGLQSSSPVPGGPAGAGSAGERGLPDARESVNGPLPAGTGSALATTVVIHGFFASPPNLTVGGTATFYVLASGGSPPLSYSYTGLPPGCVSYNLSAVPCTPTSVGTFTVTVEVIDSLSETATATTNFTVLPAAPSPLTLVAFVVYPPTISLGNFTVFVVFALGGVTPRAYSYAGLPPGCLSLSFWIDPCRPTAAGTYSVTVNVTDSANQTVSGSTVLVVGGGPPTQPSGSTVSGPTLSEIALYLSAGAAIGAAATGGAVLLWRRRRRRS